MQLRTDVSLVDRIKEMEEILAWQDMSWAKS